jgi:hypothetical protein
MIENIVKILILINFSFPILACETEETSYCDVDDLNESLPENFDGDEVDFGIAEDLLEFRKY